MANFKFNLGDELKDQITGYQGIVTGRTEWLNGCKRYTVEAQGMTSDGKPKEGFNIDEAQLTLIKSLAVDVGQSRDDRPIVKPAPGGPFPTPKKFGR